MTELNLVVATDLRPKSECALARAAMLARTLGAETTLVHVVSNEAADQGVGERLRDATFRMRELAEDVRATAAPAPRSLVRVGAPAHVIAETLDELHAGLLVLGPQEARGTRDRIATVIGATIAARALATRVCPVLIAREQPRHRYRRVLMALDISANAESAIRAAEALVLSPEADASVLHAFDVPYLGTVEHHNAGRGTNSRYRQLWESHATVNVRALLRRASGDFARYGIQIEENPPARAILDAMNHQQPDLLVMGTSGRGPLGRALLGSVANEVLNHAWCDVLVVPQGSFERTVTAPDVSARLPMPGAISRRNRWH
ncbi:MAG: universal stress protein [Gammaproteobacteria bacterium]